MNHLGLTLVWLAVQVAILLAPALALNAMASRRGPAAGAWVALLSLGLVVVLNIMAFLPRIGWNDKVPGGEMPPLPTTIDNNSSPRSAHNSVGFDYIPSVANRAQALDWLRLTWDRLGRKAFEPAVRARPWGNTLAAAALAGTAVGLLRLLIGFWAVGLCCRRGRPVEDAGMTSLVEELRRAMGCRRPVALREVPDLTTPATAGRRRPVLLLPDDWRSWSDAERCAVLAHELAHIVRGDYATGLLARLAVVLNYYHPCVRWLAGRLQLQQEQAADAMGAQYAGGRTRYLVALSSLALRQDGRSPCWPARAFLPARGALIRRIAMLRDESNTEPSERPLSRAGRMLTLFGLLGLTLGVATLRGPARGADDGPSPVARAEGLALQFRDTPESFATPYVREGPDGVIVVRPAAAFRHTGLGPVFQFYRGAIDEDASQFEKELKIDTSRQGFLKIRLKDIEWITAGIGFGRSVPPKDPTEKPLHAIRLGTVAVRMVGPFDWPKFLRQWRFECEAAHNKGRTYYKVTANLIAEFKGLGPNPCVFLPDDRTIIFDQEDVIRGIASGEEPAPPAYLRDKEWERASHGLVAVAIKNRDETFAKHYDLGRPDDPMVLSLFKGINQWIVSADDADPIVLHADAASRNRVASEAISRSIDSLIKLGRQYLEHDVPKSLDAGAHDHIARMLKALAANVRVEHTDTAITVHAQNFGSLADFGAIVVSEEREPQARVATQQDARQSAKQ